MAEFLDAYNHVMDVEKFELTNDPDDKGGLTYAGITRKNFPEWSGWALIDRGEAVPERLVCDFYRDGFWLAISGPQIVNQRIATSLFSFAVNAGVRTAVKRAQEALWLPADGVIGVVTLFALNTADPALFLARFALVKIAKYRDICTADPTQKKFLLGWINRTLSEVH